jgi:hypothetical protein
MDVWEFLIPFQMQSLCDLPTAHIESLIFVFAISFVGEESLRINSELQCVEKFVQGDLITGLICVLDLCDGWCLVGVLISKIFVSIVA